MNCVFDDRTNEILFESEDSMNCINFMEENYHEEDGDFPHIWLGKSEAVAIKK